MRKQVSILICLFVLLFTLTGCLGQSQSNQDTGESEDPESIIEQEENADEDEEEIDYEAKQEELRKLQEEAVEQWKEDQEIMSEILKERELVAEDCDLFTGPDYILICEERVKQTSALNQ